VSELDDYRRAMLPDHPEPMCVRLCATVARLRVENERLTERGYAAARQVAELAEENERLRGERREAIRALVYACHSGGMDLSEYVPDCLMADAVERERRVDAALEGRE